MIAYHDKDVREIDRNYDILSVAKTIIFAPIRKVSGGDHDLES